MLNQSKIREQFIRSALLHWVNSASRRNDAKQVTLLWYSQEASEPYQQIP